MHAATAARATMTARSADKIQSRSPRCRRDIRSSAGRRSRGLPVIQERRAGLRAASHPMAPSDGPPEPAAGVANVRQARGANSCLLARSQASGQILSRSLAGRTIISQLLVFGAGARPATSEIRATFHDANKMHLDAPFVRRPRPARGVGRERAARRKAARGARGPFRRPRPLRRLMIVRRPLLVRTRPLIWSGAPRPTERPQLQLRQGPRHRRAH